VKINRTEKLGRDVGQMIDMPIAQVGFYAQLYEIEHAEQKNSAEKAKRKNPKQRSRR